MFYKKSSLILAFFLFFGISNNSICNDPLYFSTACSGSYYFYYLLNLIGTIHEICFDNLGEIAVFDLGMTDQQKKYLNKIKKISVYDIEKTNSGITKKFVAHPDGKIATGWFSWKFVILKQSLELFPYFLYLDAGTTLLKPIDHLFAYIKKKGYFLATIGNESDNGKYRHPVGWGMTEFVKKKFGIETPEKEWILDQEIVMGGIMGFSKKTLRSIVYPLYYLSFDLRNFADDGTTKDGFGTGRHDQVLLSIMAYSKGWKVFKQDYTQAHPMVLKKTLSPLYITWNGDFVCEKTHIYSSRYNLKHFKENTAYIQFK